MEHPVADETFGAFLRRLREAKGLSQLALAKELGIAQPTISAWEADVARPTVPGVLELAKALDADLDGLVRLAAQVKPVDNRAARTG